jgi:hypothetical protein
VGHGGFFCHEEHEGFYFGFWILDCGILNRQDAKNAKNSFWISDFGIVSDFELRVSDLIALGA